MMLEKYITMLLLFFFSKFKKIVTMIACKRDNVLRTGRPSITIDTGFWSLKYIEIKVKIAFLE